MRAAAGRKGIDRAPAALVEIHPPFFFGFGLWMEPFQFGKAAGWEAVGMKAGTGVYRMYRSNIIFTGKFEIQKKSGKIR